MGYPLHNQAHYAIPHLEKLSVLDTFLEGNAANCSFVLVQCMCWSVFTSDLHNHCLYLQDMYQRFLETGDDKPEPDVPKEEDPFWEPAEDVLIGTATAYLQSLLYALDFNDSLTVVDYKGQLTSEGQGSDSKTVSCLNQTVSNVIFCSISDCLKNLSY